MGLGYPKPLWGELGRRGSGGLQLSTPHMGDAIPWSSQEPKEKPDTLGGSEHHFTEGLATC